MEEPGGGGSRTTDARINAMANIGLPNPSWKPMAEARAVTVDE